MKLIPTYIILDIAFNLNIRTMKILFSPAITFMNQLNYRKKFALLGIISMMAMGVLIYSLFLVLNQVVKNSQQELQGLDLIIPVSLTIQSLQQHRALSAGWLGGNNDMLSLEAAKEFEVSHNLEVIESQFPKDLLTNKLWQKIKENWETIKTNGLHKPIADNFYAHTQLLEQLQSYKILVADNYALTFDSEIDTFYLIDTSLNKLPEAMEQLAQIRAFGTSIMAKKTASQYQRVQLIALIAKLEVLLKHLVINLNKTASFNPSISHQLNSASSEITQSAQQIIHLVEFDILQEKFQTQPDDFFIRVTKAIDNSYTEMYQILLPASKSLINTRLQHAQDMLYRSIGIALILMLMVIYFVLGSYFSLNDNVQSLTHTLKEFADGNLRQRINLQSQDELKQIGHEFNLLAEKITYLLANVENSQKKMQQVLDSLLTMAGILLPDGTLDFANSTPLNLAGLKQNDVLGKKLWQCPWFSYSQSAQQQIRLDCQAAARGESVEREIQYALGDNKIWVDFSVHPVFDEQKKVKFLVTEARDATRRRIAEEHSKRSQKMDALGKLVGGIAHDYNNMLGVILGYAELLEMKYEHKNPTHNYIQEIIRAGERGRSLTRRMLAFSKSESSRPSVCHINEVLISLKDMLAKSLTASINMHYDLCKTPWAIWLDVNELEDAVLNMSINAKYAMSHEGILTIKTQNIYLAGDEASLLGLTANDYLKLTITDTGCGIDNETKAHIFDPFFTTKGDAGSGLGLSQVFRFVERSGGAINVYTQVGEGTQFSLYFPRYNNNQPQHKTFDKRTTPRLTGDETILVVDDEPALRELANQILTHFGYQVLLASCGEVALNILSSHAVDLMLSDVIMPNMDGYQLARQVLKHYPSVKIQLASGFSDNRHTAADKHLRDNILHKPYSSEELLSSIRLLLDSTW